MKSKLISYREQQKYYYDKNAKVCDEIQPGDTVRIHTPNGWKPAECVGTATYPRSLVKSEMCVGIASYPRLSVREKSVGTANYPRLSVKEKCGGTPSYPRSYIVKAGDRGRQYRRNTEHLL